MYKSIFQRRHNFASCILHFAYQQAKPIYAARMFCCLVVSNLWKNFSLVTEARFTKFVHISIIQSSAKSFLLTLKNPMIFYRDLVLYLLLYLVGQEGCCFGFAVFASICYKKKYSPVKELKRKI